MEFEFEPDVGPSIVSNGASFKFLNCFADGEIEMAENINKLKVNHHFNDRVQSSTPPAGRGARERKGGGFTGRNEIELP